jgi:hypothetical protein
MIKKLFAPRCALHNGASGKGMFLAPEHALHNRASGGKKINAARGKLLQRGHSDV